MPGNWQGSDRAARLPSDWLQRCAQVRARDGDTCWVCGRPDADQIDHKVRGDDHSLENLGPIHQDVEPYCHRAKSSAEGHAARAALRAQLKLPKPRHPGLIS